MKIQLRKKFLSALILLLFIFPLFSFAQTSSIQIENPLEGESFEDIIDGLINFIFEIAILAVPLMIIWAAFLFVTSIGDIDKINQAKRIIIYALMGFAVILLAKGLIAIIKEILGIET